MLSFLFHHPGLIFRLFIKINLIRKISVFVNCHHCYRTLNKKKYTKLFNKNINIVI